MTVITPVSSPSSRFELPGAATIGVSTAVEDASERVRATMLGDPKLHQLSWARADMLAREKTRRISAAPIFAGLAPANQALLAAAARLVRARDGQVVIREGDQATSVYLIGTGEVVVENAAGRVLAQLAAGELIGEVAAATGTHAYRLERTASVRAVGPTTLYEFPASSIKRLMAAEPAARRRIRNLIEQRLTLRQLHQHLQRV
jgi:CRP-like cAMP-binding protein